MNTHTENDDENEEDERLFYLDTMKNPEKERRMTARRDMLMSLMRRVFHHNRRFKKSKKTHYNF